MNELRINLETSLKKGDYFPRISPISQQVLTINQISLHQNYFSLAYMENHTFPKEIINPNNYNAFTQSNETSAQTPIKHGI
jgi:hypothetical protein